MNIQVWGGQPKIHEVDHVVILAAGQAKQEVLGFDVPDR
jgi:hypothetical protein